VSGTSGGPDLTLWQYWWGFNREPYLNLKSHIHSGSVQTGSDEFFLGRGEQAQSRDSLRPSELVIREKVVPALVKALKTEQSNDIISGCLVALAKIGDAKTEGGDGKSQMAEAIKSRLTDGSQEIQETAAVSLGILANETNVELLTALLFNDSSALSAQGISYNGAVPERTRAFAAYGLGLVGFKASDAKKQLIVESLIKMLEGEGKTMQREVPVACLTSLGLVPLAIDATSAPLDISKATPRPEKVTNRQEQILWLLHYYVDEQNEFLNRAHVPTAIARLLVDAESGNWLRTRVGERFLADIGKQSKAQHEIQQSCIIALGMIGDCDADSIDTAIREGLMKVFEDLADEQSQVFSLIALAQAAGRPGGGEGGPTAGLDPAKKGKGTSPRAFLMDKLGGKSTTKSWAALALAVMERSLDDNKQASSAESKAALQKTLEDAKSPGEIGALAIAVGIARHDGAKDVLRDKFEKISEPEARGNAAIGLGLMNDRGSIATITDVLKKSKYQPDLLKAAAIGLGLLGDKDIVPALIDMLNEASALSSQAAISNGLGFIGDSRSIKPLIKLLEDKEKTDRARGFAAVALGIVADKEELPWNAKISVNINYRANTTTLTSPELGTGILDIL
jgi:HEAT repeat protein